MATQNPIQVSSGQLVVDTSIIPFIRKNDIEFAAGDLKPYKAANFFFDDVDVSRLVQRSSTLVLTPNNALSNTALLSQGEGLYNGDSGAFGTVVDVSPDNNVYLNENYITFTVSGASLGTSSYSKGDLIYQNGTATASPDAVLHTFLGKVVYWDFYNLRLIVSLTSGYPNTTGGNPSKFFKVGVSSISPDSLDARLSTGRFAVGNGVASVDTPTNGFIVASYTNYSGLVIDGSGTTITTSSDLDGSFSGSGTIVRITSGSGVGQQRVIQSINGNQITLLTQLSTPLTADSRYSITIPTVDKYGRLSGIFNLPEDPTLKFRTGERVFTITDSMVYDDPDAQMKATAKYVASGLLNQTQEVRFTPIVVKISPAEPSSPTVVGSGPVTSDPTTPVKVTPETPISKTPHRRLDPVAQTFFTPDPKSLKQNYGIFVSSIDVFFKERPAATSPQLPVTIRLVTTVNGYPTKTIIASSTLYPKDVTATQTTDSYAIILSKGTNFVFGDPVYLEPKTEYAIVVYSESPDYEVWISELGQNIIGTDRRISEQPYAGSFFRSQNASTWTPFQNQDLMFVINKAVFNTADIAVLNFNPENPVSNVFLDQMLLHTADLDFPDTKIKYYAKTTLASDGTTRDASYFEVPPNTPYNFGQDLKNSSKELRRRRIIKSGDGTTMNVQVVMSTNDSDISPMFNLERFSMIANENKINNGALSIKNVTVTNPGGNHVSASNGAITCNISAPQLSTGTQAEAIVLANQIDSSGNLTGIYFINAGSGYIENPTITIEDSTLTSENAKVTITSETSSSGGNASARYLTRKISLADGFDAGDIRIFLKAIRPFGTNIIAYYKVLSATDPSHFADKNWKKLDVVNENYSIDQTREVELQFRPSLDTGKLSYTENGIEYPLGGKFKDFAIKLVLLAEDTTVVPYVKNIRVIATPAG